MRERDFLGASFYSLCRTAGEGGSLHRSETGDGAAGGTTLGAFLDSAATALAAAGFDEARRRARRLCAAALDLAPAEVFAHPERPLPAAEKARLEVMLSRMLAHEPLSRIVGRREFWGLEFALSPDTLDPRADSETLVEAVLARFSDRTRPYRLLDLGAGSGCLLLALLQELPRASGVGVDLSPGAAVTARRNGKRLGLDGRAVFVAGNWAEAIACRFDIVVANPPYIATPEIAALPASVKDYDPILALDGGRDGLSAYRTIAARLVSLVKPGGLFATEIGIGQGPAVAAIVTAGGLAVESIIRDLAGIERCLVARRD